VALSEILVHYCGSRRRVLWKLADVRRVNLEKWPSFKYIFHLSTLEVMTRDLKLSTAQGTFSAAVRPRFRLSSKSPHVLFTLFVRATFCMDGGIGLNKCDHVEAFQRCSK
jgi:hypothetical protein